MASMKALQRLASRQTAGQKKIEKPLRNQRGYAKGQLKAAGATGLTMAALGQMSLSSLRKAKAEAQTEAQRAKIQAAIEKELRKLAQEENKPSMKGKNTRGTSPKPKLRPQNKAKGGAVKKTKMKAGGYAKKKK